MRMAQTLVSRREMSLLKRDASAPEVVFFSCHDIFLSQKSRQTGGRTASKKDGKPLGRLSAILKNSR